MERKISSLQNDKIKNLLKLYAKSRERKKQGVFVVEGPKELWHAINSGYEVVEIYYCDTIFSVTEVEQLKTRLGDTAIFYQISSHVFEKTVYRDSTGGVVSVLKSRSHSLDQLKLKKNPLIMIADGIEKPGNVGALLRTADAANVDAVILTDMKSDLYNPNVIRSSVGCLFGRNIVLADSCSAIEWLKENGLAIYVTYLEASIPYTTADFSKGCAIVVGNEATGVKLEWVKAANQNLIIPMRGINDSLNVSVSAAIVVFEALRQRDIAV